MSYDIVVERVCAVVLADATLQLTCTESTAPGFDLEGFVENSRSASIESFVRVRPLDLFDLHHRLDQLKWLLQMQVGAALPHAPCELRYVAEHERNWSAHLELFMILKSFNCVQS